MEKRMSKLIEIFLKLGLVSGLAISSVVRTDPLICNSELTGWSLKFNDEFSKVTAINERGQEVCKLSCKSVGILESICHVENGWIAGVFYDKKKVVLCKEGPFGLELSITFKCSNH
jgi:hypothetical protein